MYARTRDIEARGGICLRICIEPSPFGAMVRLERLDGACCPSALLSLYGTEILSGFVMAARLSIPFPIPDENVEGHLPVRFHLDCSGGARVVIEQEGNRPLLIDEPLWDRLYAELCLVIAHGRELARLAGISLH